MTDLPSPLVKNNVIYVPIRTAQSLGYKVIWDNESKTISIINKTTSDKLNLTIGSNIAMKNGEKLKLDTPPFIKSNTTYVPLRFISENFGAVVDWDSKNNRIVVMTPNPMVQAQLKSGDLSKARLAVIGLPRLVFIFLLYIPKATAIAIFSLKITIPSYILFGLAAFTITR